jgi:hypothetical protein
MPQAEEIQLRNGTAAQWTTANPILNAGELGVETDTHQGKIGDGVTSWVSLPYIGVGASGGATTAQLNALKLTPTAIKTAAYNAAVGDFVPCNAVSGGFTVTLPTAPVDGALVSLKKIDTSTNVVTIACGGSDTLNTTGGPTSGPITLPNQGARFQYFASAHIWYSVSTDIPLSQIDLRYLSSAPSTTYPSPVLSGTVTGTYTLAGTPSFSWSNAIPLSSLQSSAYATTATASTLAERDTNGNLLANNHLAAQGSITSAAGITYLTIASQSTQIVTGSTTQTVSLPTTSINAGFRYTITNQSSGTVTVGYQSSGGVNGGTVATLPANYTGIFTATVNTPVTANSWNADVWALGKIFTANNSLAFSGTDNTTFTFPATSGNVFASSLAVPQVNLPNGITNFSCNNSQTVVAATTYYVPGSYLQIPAVPLTGTNGLTANKSVFNWNVAMTKTAAGTGNFTWYIYRGVNGTTADTPDVTQILGTQTAVIDAMIVNVQLVVTTIGGTGAYSWAITPDNRASVPGTAAGFGVPGTASSAFFSGTVSSVSLSTTSTGFGLAWNCAVGVPVVTLQSVQAYALNVA